MVRSRSLVSVTKIVAELERRKQEFEDQAAQVGVTGMPASITIDEAIVLVGGHAD